MESEQLEVRGGYGTIVQLTAKPAEYLERLKESELCTNLMLQIEETFLSLFMIFYLF